MIADANASGGAESVPVSLVQQSSISRSFILAGPVSEAGLLGGDVFVQDVRRDCLSRPLPWIAETRAARQLEHENFTGMELLEALASECST